MIAQQRGSCTETGASDASLCLEAPALPSMDTLHLGACHTDVIQLNITPVPRISCWRLVKAHLDNNDALNDS